MTVTSALLDRIHAVNATIAYSKLTAYRYFPGTSAKFPFIVPLLGAGTHEGIGTRTGGEGVDVRSVRQVTLLCGIGSPRADNPVETAHRDAEAVVDPVLIAYYTNPYLSLGGVALDSVADAVSITSDTGIVENQGSGLFEIRFTLTVPLIRSYD